MVEKQTEMSLDEVLSSIKQMVVDKDPPVLELTDMVSPDGSIVKVKNGHKDSKDNSELKDFLRLAQENGRDSSLFKDASPVRRSVHTNAINSDNNAASNSVDDSIFSGKNKGLPQHADNENLVSSNNAKITVNEIIREVAAPIISNWLEKNLPGLAKEIVTAEIQKMMKQN